MRLDYPPEIRHLLPFFGIINVSYIFNNNKTSTV
jgi:hypothetical protein